MPTASIANPGHLLGRGRGGRVAGLPARRRSAAQVPGAVDRPRVVVDPSQRGTGLGHVLIAEALRRLRRDVARRSATTSARRPPAGLLRPATATWPVGETYLEDDIPHIAMEARRIHEHRVNARRARRDARPCSTRPPPFEDVNLFETNAALRDALKFKRARGWPPGALSALGAAGRPAPRCRGTRAWPNLYPPTLHSHDRFGNRIDEVEFPSELPRAAGARHWRTACTARRWAAAGPQPRRARPPDSCCSPSSSRRCCCPVSMTYAVTPRAGAPTRRLQQAFGGLLASPRYDATFTTATAKTGD